MKNVLTLSLGTMFAPREKQHIGINVRLSGTIHSFVKDCIIGMMEKVLLYFI